MKKPRLYIDVDGVILALYNNHFQMRPHVGMFLKKATELFRCFWLTCHPKDSTDAICRLNSIDPNSIERAHWVDHYLDKVGGVIKTGGVVGDWWVIEDEYPLEPGKEWLRTNGLLDRWIIMPSRTPHTLFQAMKMLEGYVARGGRLVPPHRWATTLEIERKIKEEKRTKNEKSK